MIRLKTLLTEIALNTITPYATQIVWMDMYQAHSTYTAEVTCDGIPVKLQIDRQRRLDGYIYQFSFFMPKMGGPGADGHQSYINNYGWRFNAYKSCTKNTHLS